VSLPEPPDWNEADAYEVLRDHDVDPDPPDYRPVGPGDVFGDVDLAHLTIPFTGPVVVVGHPCSLRRGIDLVPDVPVAPISEPGIPSGQHPFADKVLPVKKLLPPGSSVNMVVQLVRTTTISAASLTADQRSASLNRAGVIALQQRVVGNQIRARVPPGVIAAHCRGPLAELELWTDWRESCVVREREPDSFDVEFDSFMSSESGFEGLSWRVALAKYEHAAARAVPAMTAAVAQVLDSSD
jgi:hypothetical protein